MRALAKGVLTWASPTAADLVEDWKVLEVVETLSDHRYLSLCLRLSRIPRASVDRQRASRPAGVDRNARLHSSPRWSLTNLDQDMLIAAAQVAIWPDRKADLYRDAEKSVITPQSERYVSDDNV